MCNPSPTPSQLLCCIYNGDYTKLENGLYIKLENGHGMCIPSTYPHHSPYTYYVLLLIIFLSIKVASASFSLEHPSQFFLESRKIRGGLIKQEHPALPKESAEAIDSDNFNMDTELGTLSEKDFNDDMTIDI